MEQGWNVQDAAPQLPPNLVNFGADFVGESLTNGLLVQSLGVYNLNTFFSSFQPNPVQFYDIIKTELSAFQFWLNWVEDEVVLPIDGHYNMPKFAVQLKARRRIPVFP